MEFTILLKKALGLLKAKKQIANVMYVNIKKVTGLNIWLISMKKSQQ